MIQVSSLDRSIAFYRDALGMRELRRETFTDGRFTLVFVGYPKLNSTLSQDLAFNRGQKLFQKRCEGF